MPVVLPQIGNAVSYNKEIDIPLIEATLGGELTIPKGAESIVIFAHGSGSSRKSPRNLMISRRLREHNIGTLLFDLLTEEEDSNYYNRFDIDLLTKRLVGVTRWLEEQKEARYCRIGYFGASTGAASALRAAVMVSGVAAIVSRGGRPDLALNSLGKVHTPVLLIVGSLDPDVLQLNEIAYSYLTCEKKLKIIDGASHLFEEGDKLDRVAEEATEWFVKYLSPVNDFKTKVYV
jgi:putative phosphoribosyl transferase